MTIKQQTGRVGPNVDEIDYRRLFNTANEKKNLLAAILFLFLAAALILAIVLPPKYVSVSQIQLVKREGVELTKEYIQSQKAMLMNEIVTISVLNKMNLMDDYGRGGLFSKFVAGITSSDDDSITDLRLERAVNRYSANLTVSNLPNSFVFDVVLRSFDPSLSVNLANSHVESYLEFEYNRRKFEYDRASSALVSEISKVQSKLTDEKRQLVKFAVSNNVVDLELDGRELVELKGMLSEEYQKLSPAVQAELDILKRNYVNQRTAFLNLSQRLESLSVELEVSSPVAIVLSEAVLSEQVFPKISSFLMVSLFVGLIFCVFIVVSLTYISKSDENVT